MAATVIALVLETSSETPTRAAEDAATTSPPNVPSGLAPGPLPGLCGHGLAVPERRRRVLCSLRDDITKDGVGFFDSFVSTKPGGMGMGLSISRTIIEAHGGQLWVEPNREGGAVFRFTLPAAPPPDRIAAC